MKTQKWKCCRTDCCNSCECILATNLLPTKCLFSRGISTKASWTKVEQEEIGTTDENTLVHKGETYYAHEISSPSCTKCGLSPGSCFKEDTECRKHLREDGREIIWEKTKPPTTSSPAQQKDPLSLDAGTVVTWRGHTYKVVAGIFCSKCALDHRACKNNKPTLCTKGRRPQKDSVGLIELQVINFANHGLCYFDEDTKLWTIIPQ